MSEGISIHRTRPRDGGQPDEWLHQFRWLRGLVRRLVDQEAAADDAVRETELAALEAPPRGRGPAMRAWFARTLSNVVHQAVVLAEPASRPASDGARAEHVLARRSVPFAPGSLHTVHL